MSEDRGGYIHMVSFGVLPQRGCQVNVPLEQFVDQVLSYAPQRYAGHLTITHAKPSPNVDTFTLADLEGAALGELKARRLSKHTVRLRIVFPPDFDKPYATVGGIEVTSAEIEARLQQLRATWTEFLATIFQQLDEDHAAMEREALVERIAETRPAKGAQLREWAAWFLDHQELYPDDGYTQVQAAKDAGLPDVNAFYAAVHRERQRRKDRTKKS